MATAKLSLAFLGEMAAKTTGRQNAVVTRYTPSTGKMLNENVDLNIYVSE